MFFLRCAFWLSIVYSTMTWTTFGPAPQAAAARAVEATRVLGSEIATRAVAGATDFCLRHASDCARDAARLTALVAAPVEIADDTTASPASAGDTAPVPLPIPDPRRLKDAKAPRMP